MAKAKKAPKFEGTAPLIPVLEDMLEYCVYWHSVSPLRASLEKGHPKVLVVAGENCTGKSFFVEVLRSWFKAHVTAGTSICVSIRERTGAGSMDMAGMRRTMMFGDESVASTGATSVGVITRAFGNLDSRAKDKYQTLLVLDEPEIGLSEGYTKALGTYIGQCAQAMPEPTAGLVVVTHSRSLVKALQAEVGTPSFVHLGDACSVSEWLSSDDAHSVQELLALSDKNHTLFRAISDFEDSLKKQQGTP